VAIKPTIYKANIVLSDLNRDYYDNISLTLAQHPSETIERMMARIIAFCVNADPDLVFTKGLSEVEEPDIWKRSLDGQIERWLDIGEPDVERIKKASHKAKSVEVYSFNSKSDVWWEQSKAKFNQLDAQYFRFNWEEIKHLASFCERTMAISVLITGESAFVTMEAGECEINWQSLS
jgi:uncharacterized protein YaeQ